MLVTGPGYCSGVVIDEKGTVATAYHCVAGGQKSLVQLEDGRTFYGRTITANRAGDLALIAVPKLAGKVAPMKIRTSLPRRGEVVYAMGHPFAPLAEKKPWQGTLRWSLSKGIISAVGDRYIQTDVALNPGNSGGPIIDEQGRIVGIASRKINGDNLSFLGLNTSLLELDKERDPVGWFGGYWYLGLAYNAPATLDANPNLGLVLSPIIRDRVVLSGQLSLSGSADNIAQQTGRGLVSFGAVHGALRQRIGRGRQSMTIDVGGGIDWLEEVRLSEDLLLSEIVQGQTVFGRIGISGFGFRYSRIFLGDEQFDMVSLDIDSPGVFSVF